MQNAFGVRRLAAAFKAVPRHRTPKAHFGTTMKILTSDQMRNIDRRATERFGVPSMVLMENAAIAVVDAIFERYADAERISIFCGPGKDGGDGLAVARHLQSRGVVTAVFLAGDRRQYDG